MNMRIVSWNCAMGFSKKRPLIDALQADVAILPEVSRRDISEIEAPFRAWVGSNPHKGLGVIARRSYVLHEADGLLPWHITFTVDGTNIIGLWAHVRDKDLKYVRVTHEVVDQHAAFLASGPSLLVGDFNSNTVWDSAHPGLNHSMLVYKLHGLSLRSVHHNAERLAHGAEATKTYFHTKEAALRPPHRLRLPRGASASLLVGSPEDWQPYSDHMPLILDIDHVREANEAIH